jgi:hypothetical protein
LISTSEDIILDKTSESEREREFDLKLIISSIGKSENNVEIYLKIFDVNPKSSVHEELNSIVYKYVRAINPDF